MLKNCQSKFFRRIEGCKKKHHTLLHEETQVNINVSSANHNLSATYLQVLQICVSNGDVSMKVNARLVSGSDATLVTKTLAVKLKLEGKSQILTLSNAVCWSTKTISKLVNFYIFPPLHPSKIPIANAWVIENLDLPRFKINKNTIKKEWKHLQDLPIEVNLYKNKRL